MARHPAFSTVRHVSMPERVRDVIAASIRDGRLRSGEALPSQGELAEQFGVSRLVIREALRALEAVDAVALRPGRKAVVLGPPTRGFAGAQGWPVDSDGEVLEFVSIRLELEGLSAERAAEQATAADLHRLAANVATFEREASAPVPDVDRLVAIDIEFHRLIADAARATTLARLIAGIAPTTVEARRTRLSMPHMPDKVAADHRRIFAAIAARDSAAAREAVRGHLNDVIVSLRDMTTVEPAERETPPAPGAPPKDQE